MDSVSLLYLRRYQVFFKVVYLDANKKISKHSTDTKRIYNQCQHHLMHVGKCQRGSELKNLMLKNSREIVALSNKWELQVTQARHN